MFLKEIEKGKEEDDEDVNSYWMILSKGKDKRHWNLKKEVLDCNLWRTRL
jgi:hypothetical protein